MATTELLKRNGFEMEERKEPQLIKFDAEGQTVEGVLLSITKAMVGDPNDPKAAKRPVTKYIIDTGDGEKVSLLGSYDIASKIEMGDRGKYVYIRYEGEDRGVVKNGNALRRFHVEISKLAVITGKALADSTMITDDDIPF